MKNLASLVFYLFIFLSYSQDLDLQLFTSGLDKPVNIKNAKDNRLFVVEQDGFIRIINSDGSLVTQPFLDIDNRVKNLEFLGDERGMLGLAFHPNYVTNGFFYVNYINNSGDTIISRFSRDDTNTSLADPNSESILLTISQPFENHNGGDMAFGQDGFLYIATGDGGSSGDPGNRAQSLSNLLGKLLRIDVDNPSNGDNYGIPTSNPYVSDNGALDEIWAYGLRNPWKFSFDRDTNDLWIGDVGQGNIEEINQTVISESGINYGWRCYEGNSEFNTSIGCPDIADLTFPAAQYNHNDGLSKCSITGGYRYRGTLYPNFEGLYFFADYCSDEIGYLTPNGNGWDMTLEQFSSNNWTTFGEDNNGELYIAGISSGNLYRLVDNSVLSIDDDELNKISLYPNPAKSEITMDLSQSKYEVKAIRIYNVIGKLIADVFLNNETYHTFSTVSFENGLYIAEITSTTGETSTYKFIIN